MIFGVLTGLDTKNRNHQYVCCFCFKQKRDTGTLEVTTGLEKHKCLQLKATNCVFKSSLT